MTSTPGQEHQWLQQFVGEWTYEGRAVMGPDQPPMTFSGTESVRSIGGMWISAEGRGACPDGTAMTSILTVGYDPQKGRYLGTFIASMMSHLWVYDGSLDASRRVLTLNTEGPIPAAPGEAAKMAKFTDVTEFKAPDHRVLTSSMLGEDGQWREFMRADYRRSK